LNGWIIIPVYLGFKGLNNGIVKTNPYKDRRSGLLAKIRMDWYRPDG